LAGARTGNAVVISGKAIKVPYRSISDIPGPVTVLGLVPSDEGRRPRMMDRAYVFKRFDAETGARFCALRSEPASRALARLIGNGSGKSDELSPQILPSGPIIS
jgi:hypothetical protein